MKKTNLFLSVLALGAMFSCGKVSTDDVNFDPSSLEVTTKESTEDTTVKKVALKLTNVRLACVDIEFSGHTELNFTQTCENETIVFTKVAGNTNTIKAGTITAKVKKDASTATDDKLKGKELKATITVTVAAK